MKSLHDDGYVPFISRIHWSWMILLTMFSAGIFPLLLALYLSLWVYKRWNQGISVYIYGAITLLLLLTCIPPIYNLNPSLMETTISILVFGWLATGFVFRRELRSYYGKEFQINPILTAFFSIYYLNYCLWAIGNGI